MFTSRPVRHLRIQSVGVIGLENNLLVTIGSPTLGPVLA